MLRGLVVVMVLGCATAPSSPRIRTTPGVTVRMARDGEFPRPTSESWMTFDDWGPGSVPVRHSWSPDQNAEALCPLGGAPAPELFDDVVAFAMTNLVHRSEVHPEPIRTKLVAPGVAEASFSPGIWITVEPWTGAGHLEVGTYSAGWSGTTSYCLHVRRDGSQTTIIVEEAYTSISTRERYEAPRG